MSIDEVATQISDALESASDDERGGYERLKSEVERYRKRFKPYEELASQLGDGFESFTGLPAEDQQAIIQFASVYADGMKSGDFGAAANMSVQFARVLAGDQFAELVGVQSPDEGEPEAPVEEAVDVTGMTEDQVRKMLAEEREQIRAEIRAEEAARAQISKQLTDLGYSPDPSDPKTRAVLSLAAANQVDLAEAHNDLTAILGDPGGSPSDEAAGAAGESAGADEPTTTAPPVGVPTGGTVEPPKTFEEAGARAEARLASLDDADLLS